MKHLNVMKTMLALCLLGAMCACSSEQTAVGSVRVSHVVASDCKTSVSKDDAQPDSYADFYEKNTTLSLLMGSGNMVDAQFVDVMDNCAIGQLHVDATCTDNRIVMVLYPDRDMATDCICRYDVAFKLENMLPGDYQLEIYQTAADKQPTASNRIYQGAISLEQNKPVTLRMTR